MSMAAGGDVEVKSLLLKVDASVELLRKNLGDAGVQIDNFAKRGEQGAQRFDTALKRTGVSAGQMQFAMRDLSAQLGDAATQFSSGTSILQIFSQQSNQVVGALQLMTNETKGLLGFLGGPWGAVFSAATILLAKFAFGHDKAADAEANHKSAADQLKDSIEELEKATRGAIASGQREIFVTIARANADLQATVQKRKLIAATLDEERAVLNRQRASRAEDSVDLFGVALPGATAGTDASTSRLKELNAEYQKNEALATRAGANVRAANAKLTQQLVNEATDPAARAQGRFDRAADLLARRLEKGEIDAAKYRAEYLKLTNTLDAATQKVDAHRVAHTKLSGAQREALALAKEFNKAISELPRETQDAFKEIDRQFLEGGTKNASDHARKFYTAVDVDPKEFDGLVKKIDAARDESARKSQEDVQKRFQLEAERVRTLGTLFQDAFTGGTKAIWRDFKQIGLQVITELLAKFVIAKFAGKAFDFGNALSSSVSTALPGFASGGRPRGPSIVGERGPELFIPDAPGRIIPNNRLGGTGYAVTINAPGATAETVSMIRRELYAAFPIFQQATQRATIASIQRPRL
jgi:hypothetical protein